MYPPASRSSSTIPLRSLPRGLPILMLHSLLRFRRSSSRSMATCVQRHCQRAHGHPSEFSRSTEQSAGIKSYVVTANDASHAKANAAHSSAVGEATTHPTSRYSQLEEHYPLGDDSGISYGRCRMCGGLYATTIQSMQWYAICSLYLSTPSVPVPAPVQATQSKNSLPSPLCFFSSSRQGSHVFPYFRISLPSSSFCSFCNAPPSQSAPPFQTLRKRKHKNKRDAPSSTASRPHTPR